MNYSRYIYYETLIKESLNSIEQMYTQSRWLLLQYLDELRQEIRDKRKLIYSKQEKGQWPVTIGDQVFIRYLDATDTIIDSLIKKRWLTKWKINNVKTQLMKLTKAVETEHHSRIKVVFFNHNWSYF